MALLPNTNAMINISPMEFDLDDLKEKFKLLESDRKSFYQTSLMTMQKNKELIKQLQTENKSLREQLKIKSRPSSAVTTKTSNFFRPSDDKELMLWRRRNNESKSKTKSRRKSLLQLQDKLKEMACDSKSQGSDDNPQMRQIRILENRLDKAMIKYNEAMSIKKTYELIVKRLRDERVGYDNQLAAIEQSLKGKEHDFEELRLLSHDAGHAKEVAEGELRNFESKSEARKMLRDREVNNQKNAMQSRVNFAKRLEEQEKERYQKEMDERKRMLEKNKMETVQQQMIKQSQIESDKQKLTDYEEALRRIKDATGVSDVNEIIQKFATQDDTYTNLLELKNENDRKIQMLNDEKIRLKEEVETIKYEGTENMTRKQVDEVEKNVVSAQNKLDRNKDKYERIFKILVNVKSGIEHLYENLEGIEGMDLKLQKINIITDDTLLEALSHCEQKLVRLYNTVKKDPELEEILEARKLQPDTEEVQKPIPHMKSTPIIQTFNQRVKFTDKETDDLSDGDIDDEAEAQANERLKMKQEASLRYERLTKNKVRKTKTATGTFRTKKRF